MQRNRTTSYLLRPPPEIRNKVYELVLGRHRIMVDYTRHEHGHTVVVNDDTTHKHENRSTKTEKRERRTLSGSGLYHRILDDDDDDDDKCRKYPIIILHLGLLRVCRQVYEEAALLPYTLNIFVFRDDWVINKNACTIYGRRKSWRWGRFQILDESSSRREK